MEKIKVALLPFEVSLTQNDTTAIHTECQSDKCVRAVVSKDSRKVSYHVLILKHFCIFLIIQTQKIAFLFYSRKFYLSNI